MDKVTVLLNGKVYEMSRNLAISTLIKTAKKKYEDERRNAIVAVEKDSKIEMRRDEFSTIKAMNAQMKELKASGFKVHYVRRW